MRLDIGSGIIDQAEFIASPNCDAREDAGQPEVIIIHCISLPPGEYGGDAVQRFFCNDLPAQEHPYYQTISHLTVSAHFFIDRQGSLIQFVSTKQRAWHAGESVCLGRPKVNNFSIGIELEGLDTDPNGFDDRQYHCLSLLVKALQNAYPKIEADNVFAHSDIAPGRKPDPGAFFDWQKLLLGDPAF